MNSLGLFFLISLVQFGNVILVKNLQSAFQNDAVGHIFGPYGLFRSQQPLEIDGLNRNAIHFHGFRAAFQRIVGLTTRIELLAR